MAMRTKAGTVTEQARSKYGSKSSSPNKTGSFPVFDHHSAMSAIKLRGHANDPGAVLDRVQRWASAHGDSVVLAAVKRARQADKAK